GGKASWRTICGLMHSLGRQGTRANRGIVIAVTAKARHSGYTRSRVGVRILCCMHGRGLANGDEKMKIKIAVVAGLLLVSLHTSSAQFYNPNYDPYRNFYYQYYLGAPTAEDDLAYTKARRDKARKEREETGKSDVGARLRLQQECINAIERGVEDG